MPLDLSLAVAHALGDLLNGNRHIDVLLHDQQGTLHNRVLCLKVKRDARLWFFGLKRIINDHDMQAFVGMRAPDMLIHKIGCQMCGTHPTRTGQPIAINNENLFCDRVQSIKLIDNFGMMEPADATAIAIKQSGLVQQKCTGTNPDKGHTRGRGFMQKLLIGGAQVRGFVH